MYDKNEQISASVPKYPCRLHVHVDTAVHPH